MLRDDRDDRALAAAAGTGDRVALERLLTRHADRVHRICSRIVYGDDAADASQEALLAIARRIDRYDGRAAFSTWLYRVATNVALDELRRRRRRPLPDDDLEPSPTHTDVGDSVAARLDVRREIAALPDEFRIAVVLRDLEDLDYAQIAAVLGIPPGTVRSRIARGRALLAGRIGNPESVRDRPRRADADDPATTERPS